MPLSNSTDTDGPTAARLTLPYGRMQIIGVVSGELRVGEVVRRAGEFCLLPASLPATELTVTAGTQFLRAEAG